MLTPAGNEKYRSIIRNHYKKAAGVLLVFDLTDRSTFDET